MYTAEVAIRLPPKEMPALSTSTCIGGRLTFDRGPLENRIHKLLEVVQQDPYYIFSVLYCLELKLKYTII